MMKVLRKLFPRIGLVVLVPLLVLSAITLSAQEATPEALPTEDATIVAEPTESPAAPETLVPTETSVPTEAPSEAATEITPSDAATVETEAATSEAATPATEVDVTPETGIAPEPLFSLLVREMLDNGDLTPWTLGAGWGLVPNDANGQALQLVNSNEPIELMKGSFYNVAVQARFLSDSGDAVMSVRNSTVGSYSASLSPDGTVELYRADVLVASANVAASNGNWRIIRVSAADAVVRVAIDNVEVIVYQDSLALPSGTVRISANFENPTATNTLLMDDFFLWVLVDELGNYPAPTPYNIPPVVTQDATEEVVVTEEAVVTEEVIVTEETAATEVVAEGKDYSPFPPPTAEQLAQMQSMSTLGNDNFAGVQILSLPYQVSDNTIADTLQGEETMPACGLMVSNTVWFNYTPSVTGSYRLSTTGSAFDTILAIYTGDDVGELNQVACNDDASATNLSSQITLNLSAGEVYHIQLGGFMGRYGNYTLLVQQLGLAAPSVPTLLNPLQGAKTNNPMLELSWNTSLNAHQYEVQVATNATFTANLQTYFVPNTNTYMELPGLLPTNSTVYYWRVRAINGSSVASAFSATRNFTLDTTPPLAPVLRTPNDNTITTNSRPAVTWTAVTGASGYEIALDNDNDMNSPEYIINVTGTSYTFNTLPQGIYYWRMRAYDAAGNISAVSLTRSFTIKILSLPANDAVIITNTGSSSPQLRWVAVPGVTAYWVQLDDDTDFSNDLVVEVLLGNVTSYTVSPALPEGNYYWQVIPVGLEQANATFNHFIISPPLLAAPSLIAPANAAKTNDVSTDLSWNAVTDAAQYQVQWATNSAFTANMQTTIVNSPGDSLELPDLPLTNSTVYYWRVRTINSLGAAGSYSAARTFTLDTTVPATPNLSSPALGAFTTDATPTFTWTAVTGATSYLIEYSSDILFTSPLNATVSGTSYTPSSPLMIGGYFWRVTARDAAGNSGSPSAMRHFTLSILTSPANHTVIFTNIGEASPTLQWAAYPGATGYTVQIDDDMDFNNGYIYEAVLGLVTSHIVSPALLTDVYYWQVIPQGVGTVPTFSYRFTISPTALPAPALLLPAQAERTNDVSPTLQWDSVVDAHMYEVQWATNASFTANLGAMVVMSTNHTTPDLPLTSGTTYYWRVRSMNSLGVFGAYSAARTFTLDTTAPALPNLTALANNAVTSNSRPTFTWSAVTGASSYYLDIDNDSDFSSVEQTHQIGATSFTLPTALPQGTYYWQVRVQDAALNMSTSAMRSFTVKILTAPANNLVITTTTGTSAPVLRWAAVSGATGYIVQIDDDTDFSADLVQEATLGLVTSYTVSPALVTGVYYWQVIPIGFEQSTAIYNQFTITPGSLVAPVLQAPANNTRTNNVSTELSWSPVPSALQYEVQWSTSSTFTTGTQNSIVNEPTTALTLPTLANTAGTIYYWRVRTINEFGVAGPYSVARRFTLDTLAPPVPVLISPANDSTSTVNPVQFRWNASTGAVRYELRYGWDNPPSVEVNNITTTSYTLPNAVTLASWFWMVRAIDAAGNVSDWSEIREFKLISGNTAAPIPNYYPSNTFTLAWTPISWTSSGGYYQIQVDNSNTFGSPEFINNNISSSSPSVEVTGLSNGIWYWRVRACNASNVCGAWSTIGIFVVDEE